MNDKPEAVEIFNEIFQKLTKDPDLAFQVINALLKDNDKLMAKLLENSEFAPLMKLTETLTDCGTFEVIAEPWLANDGHIYEEATLDRLIKEKQVSPYTREPLAKLIKVQTFIDIRDQLFAFHAKSKAALHDINPLLSQLNNCIPNPKRIEEMEKAIQQQPENFDKINDEQLESLLVLCVKFSNIAAFIALFQKCQNKQELFLKYVNKTWQSSFRDYPNLMAMLVREKLDDQISFVLSLLSETAVTQMMNKSLLVADEVNAITFPNLLQFALYFNNTYFCETLMNNRQDYAVELLNQKIKIEEEQSENDSETENGTEVYDYSNFFEFIFDWDLKPILDEVFNFVIKYPSLLSSCPESSYGWFFKKALCVKNIAIIELLGNKIGLQEQQRIILEKDRITRISVLNAICFPEKNSIKEDRIIPKISSILGAKFKEAIDTVWNDSAFSYTTGLHYLVAKNPTMLPEILKELPPDCSILDIMKKKLDLTVNEENINYCINAFDKYLSPTGWSEYWQENDLSFIALFRKADVNIIHDVIKIIGKEKTMALVALSINYDGVLHAAVRGGDIEKVRLTISLINETSLSILKEDLPLDLFNLIFEYGTADILNEIINLVGQDNCKPRLADRENIQKYLEMNVQNKSALEALIETYFPIKEWLISRINETINKGSVNILTKLFDKYHDELQRFQKADFEQILKNTSLDSFLTDSCLVLLCSSFSESKDACVTKLRQVNGLPPLFFLCQSKYLPVFLTVFKSEIYEFINHKFEHKSNNYENILDYIVEQCEIDTKLLPLFEVLSQQQRAELLKPVFHKRKNFFKVTQNFKNYFTLVLRFPHLVQDLFDELVLFFQYTLLVTSLGEGFALDFLKKEELKQIALAPFSPVIKSNNANKEFANILHFLLIIGEKGESQGVQIVLKRLDSDIIREGIMRKWHNNTIGLEYVLLLPEELSSLVLGHFSRDDLSAALFLQHDEYSELNFLQFTLAKFPLEKLFYLKSLVNQESLKEAALQCDFKNCNALYMAIQSKDIQRLSFIITEIFANDLTLAAEPISIDGNIMQLLLEVGTFEMVKLVVDSMKPSQATSLFRNIDYNLQVKQNPDYKKITDFMFQYTLTHYTSTQKDQNKESSSEQNLPPDIQLLLRSLLSSQPNSNVGEKRKHDDDKNDQEKYPRR